MIDVGGPCPLWVVPFPSQVVLDCVRKITKHEPDQTREGGGEREREQEREREREGKPARCFFHVSCLGNSSQFYSCMKRTRRKHPLKYRLRSTDRFPV